MDFKSISKEGMPKTNDYLWNEIVWYEQLHNAYLRARKGKRFRPEVLRYTDKLEENLIQIQNELIWKTYIPSPQREFYVFDPKKRLIKAPAFRDRVVHHALVKVIEPMFEKKFIYDSYACIKNKGTIGAVKKLQAFTRSTQRKYGRYYVLKADISQYFYSIDITVLKRLIKRTVSDKSTLWLIDKILDNNSEGTVGLPIGALTSQLFANIYLDKLDHFVKDELGVKNYLRYMDDFILIHPEKDYLKSALEKITNFLHDELKLTMNRKTQIFQDNRGVDFCGYRIWPTHILPRKRNMRRAKKRFKRLRKQNLMLKELKTYVMTFIAYTKHCNGYNSTRSILNELFKQKIKVE